MLRGLSPLILYAYPSCTANNAALQELGDDLCCRRTEDLTSFASVGVHGRGTVAPFWAPNPDFGVNLLQGRIHKTRKKDLYEDVIDLARHHAHVLSRSRQEPTALPPQGGRGSAGARQGMREAMMENKARHRESSLLGMQSPPVEVFWGGVALSVAILLWFTASWWTHSGVPIPVGWMVCSITMNLVNKQAVQVFPATSLLIILQMLIASVFLLVFEFRRMSFQRWGDIGKWIAIPFFFAGILGTSLWALNYSTVSTVLILRSALPLLALGVDKAFLRSTMIITPRHIFCVVLVIGGSVIYTHWNVSITMYSIWLLMINGLLIIMDRSVQRYLLTDADFSLTPQLCSFLTNAVGIIPMMIIAVVSGEILEWDAAVLDVTPTSWFWVVVSGSCGCCLNYLALHAQKRVSVTTFLMMQNFNKVAVVVGSVVAFGDVLSALSVAGCAMSICGSVWYCLLQQNEIGFASEKSMQEK